METPANKIALLNAMAEGRREWEALLAQVDDAAMREPGVEGVWSVQEILAHVAGFEEYATALLRDVCSPELRAQEKLDELYQQQQLDQYRETHAALPPSLDALDGDQTNTLFVFARRGDSVGQLRAFERRTYQELLDASRALAETDLTDPTKGGGRTLLELLPNQSYGHYAMHMPAIRRWLEQRRGHSERQ